MCTCTATHTCSAHRKNRRKTIGIGRAAETSLERAERRWHDALNRGAEPVVALAAAEEVIHELKMAAYKIAAEHADGIDILRTIANGRARA